jgi:hypothetical protein
MTLVGKNYFKNAFILFNYLHLSANMSKNALTQVHDMLRILPEVSGTHIFLPYHLLVFA